MLPACLGTVNASRGESSVTAFAATRVAEKINSLRSLVLKREASVVTLSDFTNRHAETADNDAPRVFRKLLIANRGEIARRIIRVAKSHDLSTVAVYSDADEKMPFVREADEKIRIGPAPAKDSYLSIPAIVGAAKACGAEAIHPGYGFLSENGAFARACANAGLIFVGPPPEALETMKDKARSRTLAKNAGVPIVPGTLNVVADEAEAAREAEAIGYPVICKAAGGGGGIGMAVAGSAAELAKVFRQTSDRAKSAFGREGVYLERYLQAPRHIEVQILGDRHGNLIHLFERECSIQRRHQKVVEEAPSPRFGEADEGLRQRLYQAALTAARAFGYANAGTCEFMFQGSEFYFIEMNARLQVEHPVTEITTGMDLIGWQLRIAAGEKLTLLQPELKRTGAAIEFRVYAEDPVKFLPSPGPIQTWKEPVGEGVRVDAGYEAGGQVTAYYDPLLAKLIVSGRDRVQAIQRAVQALSDFEIGPLKTNLPLHRRIVANEAFRRGELDTGFLARL
jgi:acetyl-CoA carboxylase, biotin carboxylase subunit